MAKKFNLIEALKENGFVDVTVAECSPMVGCMCLERNWSKDVEVAWYGKQESKLHVEVWINPDRTVAKVYYYKDGYCRPYKTKTQIRRYN